MELTKARTRAEELIALHVPNYRFEWSNGKTVLGHCDFTARTIRLSRTLTLVNDEEQCEDTILHEIAHAIAGHSAGHGKEWKIVARRVGATPSAHAIGATDVRQTAPWVGTCPVCGNVSQTRFFRRPRNSRSCAKCCPGRYNPAYRLIYKRED